MQPDIKQAIENMRGGSANNFDGTKREPGDYTNLEADLKQLAEHYGKDSNEYKEIAIHWIEESIEYTIKQCALNNKSLLIQGNIDCGKHFFPRALKRLNSPLNIENQYHLIDCDLFGSYRITKGIIEIIKENPNDNYIILIRRDDLVETSTGSLIKALYEGAATYLSIDANISVNFKGNLFILTEALEDGQFINSLISRFINLDLTHL